MYLLLGRVVDEVDALLDVALEAFNRLLQQLLLLVGDVAEDVDGLLGAVGLEVGNKVLAKPPQHRHTTQQGNEHTPSSMGTEKKSTPVFSAISLPPGMPGR